MYSYNYNIPQSPRNMYRGINNNDQRFFGGGFVAPLLLGGVAGYALGNNNYSRPNYYYGYPQGYYYPYPTYYSNNYYYPYY
jgi:hypothetical protein